MGFTLEAACLSSTGRVRRNNEDNVYFDGSCLAADNDGLTEPLRMTAALREPVHVAVFDGMGGGKFGELAAFAAADAMRGLVGRGVRAERAALEELCRSLNMATVKKSREMLTRCMGTTVASLCFAEDRVFACNVGDSRAYRLRGGALTQLSKDHVDLRLGREYRKAPLTQHLGIDPETFLIEPTVVCDTLCDGDRYLLCRDGLTDMLSDREIADILARAAAARSAAEALVAAALERGGRDNVTVIVCRVYAD